jgi:hypothetical protein
VVSAIKDVVQRANQEQQQAFASGDPTVMKDTATGSYYRQAAQGLNDLANAGVTAIKLENLQWGDISLQGPATVRATTLETWSTTFTDGSTLRETDTNVYTLVGQGGSWLIQEDQHGDRRRLHGGLRQLDGAHRRHRNRSGSRCDLGWDRRRGHDGPDPGRHRCHCRIGPGGLLGLGRDAAAGVAPGPAERGRR